MNALVTPDVEAGKKLIMNNMLSGNLGPEAAQPATVTTAAHVANPFVNTG